MGNQLKLAFIHVNYNNSKLTINCIRSIIQNYSNADIIIVDNNSTKIEKEILFKWNDEQNVTNVQFIFEEKNLGYFGALNIGLGRILHEIYKYSFVIVGNNDLEFSSVFFERLNNTVINKNIFVIAPNIVKPNGIHQNPYSIKPVSCIRKILYKILYLSYEVAKVIFWFSSLLGVAESEKDRNGFEKSQYIFAGHGSCYVLTSNYFKYNGLLVNLTFLMGEEFILSKQISDTGGKIFYDAGLLVLHNEHSSMENLPSKRVYEYNRTAYNIIRNFF